MKWWGAAVVALTPWFPAGAVGGQDLPTALPAQGFVVRTQEDSLELPRANASRLRRDALARAVLWQHAPERAELSRLRKQPDDFFEQKDELVCKFRPGE